MKTIQKAALALLIAAPLVAEVASRTVPPVNDAPPPEVIPVVVPAPAPKPAAPPVKTVPMTVGPMAQNGLAVVTGFDPQPTLDPDKGLGGPAADSKQPVDVPAETPDPAPPPASEPAAQ